MLAVTSLDLQRAIEKNLEELAKGNLRGKARDRKEEPSVVEGAGWCEVKETTVEEEEWVTIGRGPGYRCLGRF